MIKKINGKYVVMSETTGRVFGRYKTLEYFKHLKKKKINKKARQSRAMCGGKFG